MMRVVRTVMISSVVLLPALTSELIAQTADTPTFATRFDALEQVVRKLEQRVSELNTLLRAVLPPSPVVDIEPVHLNIANAPVKGSATAKVVLIEYSDFECPFCGQHAGTVYRELHRQYVETGKVQYVFRHLPLEQLHPSALKAAEAAECARDQGKFWEMHDRLFANQKTLRLPDLLNHAQALGLDRARFDDCLVDGKTTARVNEDLTEARLRGFTGTPTFLIGEVGTNGSVKVTKKISGAHSLPIFQGALDLVFLTTPLR